MNPRIAFALLLIPLSACLRVPSSGAPAKPEAAAERRALGREVADLQKQAEALLRRQDELVWKNWTEGVGADIGGTYQGTEALFSPESIRKVERLRELTTDPGEIRALTYLQNYFVGEYLARSISDIADAIANLEASMSFSLDGRDYAYRNLDRLLANERSSVKRHELYAAATPLVERLSSSVKRKNEKLEARVLSLGYPSYEAFGAELRQVDLTELGLLAERVLDVTEKPYRAALERLAQEELQLPLDKVTRADLPRLFRPNGVDAFFPKAELLPRADATLKGLGIELAKLTNVHLDLKDGPRKNGRGLTLPVEVPADVRVSLRLSGGARDQRALFHELGHALHDAFSREKRFELAKLGNSTTAEAYAFLFEGLLEDPVWLEEKAGLSGEKGRAYLEAAAAQRLYLLRRAAGKLLYQLALHRGPAVDVASLYKSVMERTYGLRMTPDDVARAVLDEEEFYPSADVFRAWLLAGQLEEQLKSRFGAAWWKAPGAGVLLKGLWADGNAHTADEIARQLGAQGLRPDALLARVTAAHAGPPAAAAGSAAPAVPASGAQAGTTAPAAVKAAPVAAGPTAPAAPAPPAAQAPAAAKAEPVISAPALQGPAAPASH